MMKIESVCIKTILMGLSAASVVSTDCHIFPDLATNSPNAAALGSSSGASLSPPPAPEGDLLFKLLCPQSITGLIIGRKGSIINQLNVNTGARIRLSQNNEFFPGTTDRILLSKILMNI